NNSSLLYEQIIGLVLVASGCAFLAYKASTAKPTARLGRLSLRLRSLSPLIAGFVALILWITLIGPLSGGSLTSLEAYGVGVLLLITLGLIARARVTSKMSLRKFTRRKTHMATVIVTHMKRNTLLYCYVFVVT